MSPPKVDLVLVFRSSSGKIEPKALARQNARQASEQYARLLQTLKRGGLQAVGKRGERDGQLRVLVVLVRVIFRLQPTSTQVSLRFLRHIRSATHAHHGCL